MDSPSTGRPAGSVPPPPPPPPYGTRGPRQLRRLPDRGPIGGVCAGLAHYFGVDVVIVRIAAVVLAFSGPGVLAYILAWIFVPAADSDDPHLPVRGGGRDRGAQIFGIVLLGVAVSILWGGWWSPARRWVLPLALIVLGAWLVLRRDERDDGELSAGTGPGTTPEPGATPEPGSGSGPAPWSTPWSAPSTTVATSAPIDQSVAGKTVVDDTGTADDPTDETARDTAQTRTAAETAANLVDNDPTLVASTEEAAERPLAGPPPAAPEAGGGRPPWDPHGYWTAGHEHWHPRRPPLTEEERAARRRRRMVFPTVMGALLLWTGIAFLAGVSLTTGLAVALCIVGMGFVLGAFVGGSKALILPALVLAGALIASSIVDIPLEGPIGARTWTPEEIDQIDDHYQLSMGEGVVDLTELDLAGRDEIVIRASVGLGQLIVRVPDDVGVEVHADVSGGEIDVLGVLDEGIGVSTDRRVGTELYDTTIVLDLEVGFGKIEIVDEPADRSDPTTTTTTLG